MIEVAISLKKGGGGTKGSSLAKTAAGKVEKHLYVLVPSICQAMWPDTPTYGTDILHAAQAAHVRKKALHLMLVGGGVSENGQTTKQLTRPD